MCLCVHRCVGVCGACVRKREVGTEDKKRNVVSAMAGFPTKGDWRSSPAGYVNEASVFVCLEANILFTCGKQKPDRVASLYLLWMCDACWSLHVKNMSHLSSEICAASMATRSSVDKEERRPWSFSAHARTHEHLPSRTPLRVLPSNDLARPKATTWGQTRSHSNPQTTGYHPKVASAWLDETSLWFLIHSFLFYHDLSGSQWGARSLSQLILGEGGAISWITCRQLFAGTHRTNCTYKVPAIHHIVVHMFLNLGREL